MTNFWQSAKINGGGGVNTIDWDPLGTRIVAGGDNNGPKLSTDSGVTWTPGMGGMSAGNPGEELQSIGILWSKKVATPDLVWLACKAALKVSTNAGLDWTNVAWGNSPSVTPVFNHGGTRPRIVGHVLDDDANGKIYFVDNNGNVFRYAYSNANGQGGTLTKIAGLADPGTSLRLDPSNATICYVTTRGGLFQLEGIDSGSSATVRSFTAGSAPSRAEEVVAINEAGTITLYVACYANCKRVTRGTPGGGGNISTAFTTITPNAAGLQWCSVSGYRVSGTTTTMAFSTADSTAVANGFGQIWVSVNAQAATPSWTCITGDDSNMDFTNQMGGAGGDPWWGYGLRPGSAAREKTANRWIESGTTVEQIAFDPVNTNILMGCGQEGCWSFDLTSKRAYPMLTGLHSAVHTQITIDPTNDDVIYVTNSDDIGNLTTSGGRFSQWQKNEIGTPGGTTAFTDIDTVGGRWWACFGERFQDTMGDVFFNDDPNAGHSWVSMGWNAFNTHRPLGIAVRRIGGVDVVLVAVENTGIAKRVFDTGNPPTGLTAWKFKNQVAFGTLDVRSRTISMFFTNDSLVFTYDPKTGIWRSDDAGENWTKIWGVVDNSDTEGYICPDPDDPTAIYASFGATTSTSAHGGTDRGVWRLTGADSGTVEGGGITLTEIKKPGGVKFVDAVVIAAATGGRFGAVEFSGTNPSAFYSTNYGVTMTDITDDYFRRGVTKPFGSAMGNDGRWWIAQQGPGTIVWADTDFQNATGSSVGGGGGSGSPITENALLQYADTNAATSYTPSPFTPGGAGRLLVLDIITSDTGTPAEPSSVAASGLTWTKRGTHIFTATDGSMRRISSYTAISDSAASRNLTVTYSASPNGFIASMTEYNNVDALGTPAVAVTASLPTAATADTTNLASYATGAFTPAAGSLLVLHVAATDSAGHPPAVSSIVDSGGRTWTLIDSWQRTNTDEYFVAAYWALAGGSPSSTTITATFSETLTGCGLAVLEFHNVNTSTPIAQHMSGEFGSQPSATLPSAPAATSMVVAMDQVRRGSGTAWTAEAGWTTQTDSFYNTPANSYGIWTRLGDQTFTATGAGGVSWGLVYEIQGNPGSVNDPILQYADADWGSTSSKPAVTLPGAVAADGSSAIHYASVTTRNPADWDPPAGWIEIWDSGYNTPAAGVHVAAVMGTHVNTAIMDGTNGRWAAYAMEIKATTVSSPVVDFEADYIIGSGREVQFETDYVMSALPLAGLTSGSNDNDSTSYTGASITPHLNSGLWLAVVSMKSDGSTPPAPTTVVGGGYTWTQIHSLVYADGTDVNSPLETRRLTIYSGQGPNPQAQAVAFTFPSTLTGCAWAVVETPSALQYGLIQEASGETADITIDFPAELAPALILGFAAKKGSAEITPGSQMLELEEVGNSLPTNRLQVQYGGRAGTSGTSSFLVEATSGEVRSFGLVAIEVTNIVNSISKIHKKVPHQPHIDAPRTIL